MFLIGERVMDLHNKQTGCILNDATSYELPLKKTYEGVHNIRVAVCEAKRSPGESAPLQKATPSTEIHLLSSYAPWQLIKQYIPPWYNRNPSYHASVSVRENDRVSVRAWPWLNFRMSVLTSAMIVDAKHVSRWRSKRRQRRRRRRCHKYKSSCLVYLRRLQILI